MGTRFATGRYAYQSLDFWQVGALRDFTKGMNQKFLVDPSQFYYSEGIDVSKEGELKLERDLENVPGFPTDKGTVTAKYRTIDTLYLGMSSGSILKTTDGITFTEDLDTGSGKIYDFYEMKKSLFAAKGSEKSWQKTGGVWAEVAWTLTGGFTFTQGNAEVTGSDTKALTELWVGAKLKLDADGEWVEILSIASDVLFTLTENYAHAGGTGVSSRSLEDLYFVEAESDTAFGMFNDGIRQTIDGEAFIPYPPDPLWALPSSEGIALNFLSISNGGWLIGARRGLWRFTGGGSAINLWSFPDYASADNFRAMDKFGFHGLFSVERQGLWYTEGSGIYPTNLNWREDPFKTTKCKDVLVSGWDAFALVSDGSDWFLTRCNMINHKAPKFWWIVKKLAKEPESLSSLSDHQLFVHYVDKSCEVYNKVSGPYQTEGYLESPLIDENLVLLQKFYRSISVIASKFPSDTKTSVTYRLKEDDSYQAEEEFAGGGELEKTRILPNPIVGNRIQIKTKLETEDTAKTPVVSDICWRYILERPKEEKDQKRTWHFTVMAEDELEKLDFDKEELGRDDPRTRINIVDGIWNSKSKKEMLNFVGADNVETECFEMTYDGLADSCLSKIDRTNYKIYTYLDGVLDKTFSYEDKTITDLVAEIETEGDYSATIDPSTGSSELANNLIPDKDLQLKGGASIYLGTDVHAVTFTSQSPGQFKMGIEGRGSDRINVALREI